MVQVEKNLLKMFWIVYILFMGMQVVVAAVYGKDYMATTWIVFGIQVAVAILVLLFHLSDRIAKWLLKEERKTAIRAARDAGKSVKASQIASDSYLNALRNNEV